MLRKLLYTNAARVPQSNDSDLWKSSFLAPLFPREKTVEFKGKLLKIISGEGVREYVKAISHVQYVDSDLLLLRTDRRTPNGNQPAASRLTCLGYCARNSAEELVAAKQIVDVFDNVGLSMKKASKYSENVI